MNKTIKKLSIFVLALMMLILSVPNQVFVTAESAISEPIVSNASTESIASVGAVADDQADKTNEDLITNAIPTDQEIIDNALAALNAAGMFRADFSKDKNANTMIEEWLDKNGHSGIKVSIAETTDISNNSPGAGTYAKILQNGTLEYLFVDPAENASLANSGFTNFGVSFTLTKSEAKGKSASKVIQLKWDEDKVKSFIQTDSVAKFELNSYLNPNTSSDSVKQNFTLPYCINEKPWFKMKWTSDNAALAIDTSYKTVSGDYALTKAYYPVTVKQSESEQTVNITGTYNLERTNAEPITVTKTYQVTIPAIDLTDVKAKMQADLDAFFVPEVLKYRSPNAATPFDKNNVLYNFSLPNNSAIRRDIKVGETVISKGISNLFTDYKTTGNGSYYTFTPSEVDENTGGIGRVGLSANVTLPKAGQKLKTIDLTMTLQHKNYDISVSKTITLTLKPLDYSEFMAKVERKAELMELVKANLFEALNNNPNSNPSRPPRTKNEDSEKVKHDLSSRSAELSEKTDAEKLASLFDQPVSQTVTVLGQQGAPPEGYTDEIEATLVVEGSKLIEKKEDHANAHEIWLNLPKKITRETTIVDFIKNTLNAQTNVQLEMFGSWLNSIKVGENPINISSKTNGPTSSWMWYVKHQGSDKFELISSLAPDATLDPEQDPAYVKAGDVIKLKFENDARYPFSIEEQTPENPIELQDDTGVVGWTGYRGDGQNASPVREVSALEQPTRELIWDSFSEEVLTSGEWSWSATISDLISVGDNIYYAANDKLIKLDSSGKVVKKAKLAGSIQYFGRPVYSNGMIIITLEGGGVQAIDPDTMTSLWVTASVDTIYNWVPVDPAKPEGEWIKEEHGNVQSISTTYIDNGVAYTAIAGDANSTPTTTGQVRAIDMTTGTVKWTYTDPDAGFYWAGATKVGDYIIIGNDAGKLRAINDKNVYEVKSTEALSGKAAIRSTVVNQDGTLYFTTSDGVFHSIKFDPTSKSFTDHKMVKFAAGSTSTPTIYNGKAYIGGATGGFGTPGVFAVINLANMTVEFKEETVSGEVKSAPLVLNDESGNVYAYFTANSGKGLLYVYSDGKVQVAYIPTSDQTNYTTATPIVDAKGNVYYTTDSGYIIALKSGVLVENYELKIDTSGKPQAISEIKIKGIDDSKPLAHSLFKIVDFTNNIKTAYGDVVEQKIGKASYIAFGTEFTGNLEDNPTINIDLTVDQNILPLADGQKYKLYKLEGNSLVEVDLLESSVLLNKNRQMAIMPILLTHLNNQLAKQDAIAKNLISFQQQIKTNTRYVLAAVNVAVPEPSVTPKPTPAQTTKPDSSSGTTPGQAQNADVSKKAEQKSAPIAKEKANKKQDKALVKTGEQVLMIPSLVLIISAGCLILLKNKSKQSEKIKK